MVEFSDLFESEAEEFQKKAKVGSVPFISSVSPLFILAMLCFVVSAGWFEHRGF